MYGIDLTGQTALVVGAGRGVGRAVALTLAQAGARVALASRTASDLEETRSVIDQKAGGESLAVAMDATDEAAVRHAVQAVEQRWGSPDILVNSAGLNIRYRADVLSAADWDRVMAVNVRAAFLLSRAVGPAMIQQHYGRIVHVASVAAGRSGRGCAYAPSKAALVGLCRQLAVEWAPHGITVNSVSPWFMKTAFNAGIWNAEVEARIVADTPVGRLAQPEDIAPAVLFLCSREAGYLTGHDLVIDGGRTAVG